MRNINKQNTPTNNKR